MRNRWLYLPLCGAFALSFGLAGPVIAQEMPYSGYSETQMTSSAYDNGFRLGAREGTNNAREGRAFDFRHDDAYMDADLGFQGGDRDLYRHEFRRGFEAGYETAYR